MKENVIQSRTFQFSLSVIELYKHLVDEREFILSKQLLRSATSIRANVSRSRCWDKQSGFYSKNGYCIQRGQGNKILVATAERGKIDKT